MGINLEKESKALESEDSSSPQPANVSMRVYRVTNEEMTKIPSEQLQEQYWDKTSVVRIKRKGEFLKAHPEGFLQLGDELYILAPVEYFTETVSKFGEEITPDISAEQYTETAQIVVINKNAVGKSLQELDISSKFGVLLTRVTRMRIEIHRTVDFKLHKGDVLTVVGSNENIDLLGNEIGHIERKSRKQIWSLSHLELRSVYS